MRSDVKNNLQLDVESIRKDFPILNTIVHGKPLCYLDNAATTQKPLSVINAISDYYNKTNSNIHRGVHFLSETATKDYEDARTVIKKFINAKSEKEIIFTRGTTESINLVAYTFSKKFLSENDEVIISEMEHHSNIVPWQILAEEKKFKLKIIPIDENGELKMDEYERMLSPKVKLVSIIYVSNSIGTINPVREIIKKAHSFDIPVLVDAAQAVNHIPVDVQELDCEFLAFSGHKIYGPTGIGILYGKESWLKKLPPFMGGGDMISKVTFDKGTTFNELPYKFEAGTPDIAGAIGLGKAIDYISSIGIEKIASYETDLLNYAVDQLSAIKGVTIFGNPAKRTGVVSFVIENIHPHDIGTFLDFEGVAVRTGHHCTQPVMDKFNVPATSRASFAFYNTKEEVDLLVSAVKKVIEVFS
jgi:cysteine desulfurase / selenocysteine lyase